MLLKQSQKNRILAMVQYHKLSPAAFLWQEKPGNEYLGEETEIHLQNTEFYFKMGSQGGEVWLEFSPGNISRFDHQTVRRDFALIETFLNDWVKSLAIELNEPDKWAEAYQLVQQAEFQTKQVDNAPFTPTEILRIESAFADFRKQMTEQLNLQAGQLRVVNGKLDYLMAKAKDMGKMDWRTFSYGAFMELLIHENVPQNVALAMLGYLKTALEHVFPLLLN